MEKTRRSSGEKPHTVEVFPYACHSRDGADKQARFGSAESGGRYARTCYVLWPVKAQVSHRGFLWLTLSLVCGNASEPSPVVESHTASTS